MDNKPRTKKQWQAPKVIDLDVKNTKGGASAYSSEWVSTVTTSWVISYYVSS